MLTLKIKVKILKDLNFIVIEAWNELFNDSFNVFMLCRLRFENIAWSVFLTSYGDIKSVDKLNRCTPWIP